ncbi:uncharacterized protein KGF55_004635 [Candida pseudojiufengensis]|uniref:uncharacterized protein n=1 Tax=Candida pseudojiufengensis TaxID=497109 RepID=UPI002224B1EF|nr:uncharacterized protein KGF55_004635 [Candida pseudojiufengensis]KAI5960343.1 hypothetical protein KGF55_004635 [Candida pseudojiufengensis]
MNHNSTIIESNSIKAILDQNKSSYIFLFPILLLIASYYKYQNESKSKSNTITKSKASASKMDQRPFGFWEPDLKWKTPTPKVYENWSIKDTKPIPYRAFKHKYNVNMGIRNMSWDSWIELDNQWKYYHDMKLKRIEEKGEDVWRISSKAIEASWEFLYELIDFTTVRYPTLFKYDKEKKILRITETNQTFDLNDKNLNPIITAANLVQDELVIMIEDPKDGQYSLEAGCVTMAGFWKFKEKYQMKLDEIHYSGNVPKYSTNLGPAMNKFFRRLTLDSPVVRNNYFIQLDNHLDWSKSIGDEDSEKVGWNAATNATSVKDLWFRSERQSVRRLPKTGAIAFTIRTYFMPITEMCEEPFVPRRLLNGITSWEEDVNEYRGFYKFKDVLLPYLQKKAKEQEANGLVLKEEPKNYPF